MNIVKLKTKTTNITNRRHTQCHQCQCGLFFVTEDGLECNGCHTVYNFDPAIFSKAENKQ